MNNCTHWKAVPLSSLLGFSLSLLLICFPSGFALFWFSFCLCSFQAWAYVFQGSAQNQEDTVSSVFNLGLGFCNSQVKRTSLCLAPLATLCLWPIRGPCSVSFAQVLQGCWQHPCSPGAVTGGEHPDICPAGLGETQGLGSRSFLCQDSCNTCDSRSTPCHGVWQAVLKG